MEPDSSLPCSQQPTSGPCPQPDEPIPHLTTYLFKMNCISVVGLSVLRPLLAYCTSPGLQAMVIVEKLVE
jgi:hypothetical protein